MAHPNSISRRVWPTASCDLDGTLTYTDPGSGESAAEVSTLSDLAPGTGRFVANIDNATDQPVTVKFYNIEGDDLYYLAQTVVPAGGKVSTPVEGLYANGSSTALTVTPASAATGTVTVYVRSL